MRLSDCNKELKAAGYAEKLVRGKGYFYFVDGESYKWKQTGVYAWHPQYSYAGEAVELRNNLADE